MNKEYIIECRHIDSNKWTFFSGVYYSEEEARKALKDEKKNAKSENIIGYKWKFRIMSREITDWEIVMEEK